MQVKHKMTQNPICISSKQTISEVLDLMNQHDIHRLPVVDNNKLVGLVTEGVVLENSPSSATSLSMHELNYLLSKTKVADIMIKDVLTISPEALVEEAAHIMETNDIGCLPVIDERMEVIGIITTNDILKAFVDLLGYTDPGTRVVVEINDDRVGMLKDLAEVFAKENINLKRLTAHRNGVNEFVIKCEETDKVKVKKVLEDSGFKVTSIQ